MTWLASSPPPGVQPDNVEAQIQVLQVRVCSYLWECYIVSCCNGSILKPQRRVVTTTIQLTFFCALPSSIFLPSSSCSLPFFSPPRFSLVSLPVFPPQSVESGVCSHITPPWILLERNSFIPVAQWILLKSKRTSKTWMTSVLFVLKIPYKTWAN